MHVMRVMRAVWVGSLPKLTSAPSAVHWRPQAATQVRLLQGNPVPKPPRPEAAGPPSLGMWAGLPRRPGLVRSGACTGRPRLRGWASLLGSCVTSSKRGWDSAGQTLERVTHEVTPLVRHADMQAV